MKRFLLFALTAAVLVIWGGCDTEIGDSCSSHSDCSKTGDMVCERTLPGGYCTVIGCTADSCPGGSTCIAFYPDGALGAQCDPRHEDIDEDSCPPGEICLLSGLCADPSSSVTYCMKKCSSSSDCRSGYSCITTGDQADEPVSETYPPPPVKYCGVE